MSFVLAQNNRCEKKPNLRWVAHPIRMVGIDVEQVVSVHVDIQLPFVIPCVPLSTSDCIACFLGQFLGRTSSSVSSIDHLAVRLRGTTHQMCC